MSDLPTLDEFLLQARHRQFPSNSYVYEPGWHHLYLRYGPRIALGRRFEPTLDLANIEVEAARCGQGIFTDLVQRLRTTYPDLHIFVENTHNRFGRHLLKMGFVETSGEFFKSYLLEAACTP